MGTSEPDSVQKDQIRKSLPKGSNDLTIFKLADPDWALYESLGKRLQETIALSPEYAAARRGNEPKPAPQDSGFDDMDDMPF